MIRSNFRTVLVAVLSVAVLNAGGMQTVHASIVDTSAMVQTSRDASLATIQAQLAREDVRAQLSRFGVKAEAIDSRLAALSDSELAGLSKRMKEAPAGGNGVIVIFGVVFLVLLILELVGVIDIFKRVGPVR